MVRMHGPEILCDAMLGGLARWLRAAGYDAQFTYGIDDGQLVKMAEETGAVLLSSDGGIFERTVIRSGQVKSLYVPPGLDKIRQLAFVLKALDLPLQPMPRCMTCGGELAEVNKADVQAEVPPMAYAACERFWRCRRCNKLLWQGTHWQKITRTLAQAAGR